MTTRGGDCYRLLWTKDEEKELDFTVRNLHAMSDKWYYYYYYYYYY